MWLDGEHKYVLQINVICRCTFKEFCFLHVCKKIISTCRNTVTRSSMVNSWRQSDNIYENNKCRFFSWCFKIIWTLVMYWICDIFGNLLILNWWNCTLSNHLCTEHVPTCVFYNTPCIFKSIPIVKMLYALFSKVYVNVFLI